MPRRPFTRPRYPWWVVLGVAVLVIWLRSREPVRGPAGDRNNLPRPGTRSERNEHGVPRGGEQAGGAPAQNAPEAPGQRWPDDALAEGQHQVDRVVDGDTLLLRTGQRVRLLGVNSPETVKPDSPVEPWGPEASQFTKRFVAAGQVRLTFDRERLDDYGRYLAYVWVDQRLLNEELIRQGLGRATLRHPYSEAMKRRFRRAQDEARQAGRGLWSMADAPR